MDNKIFELQDIIKSNNIIPVTINPDNVCSDTSRLYYPLGSIFKKYASALVIGLNGSIVAYQPLKFIISIENSDFIVRLCFDERYIDSYKISLSGINIKVIDEAYRKCDLNCRITEETLIILKDFGYISEDLKIGDNIQDMQSWKLLYYILLKIQENNFKLKDGVTESLCKISKALTPTKTKLKFGFFSILLIIPTLLCNIFILGVIFTFL